MNGDPGQLGAGSVWADHDALLKRKFATDRETLGIEAVAWTGGIPNRCIATRGAQSGGGFKGAGARGASCAEAPGRAAKVRVDVWLIGVDTVKDLLYGRLKKVIEPGPGYVHFDAATMRPGSSSARASASSYRTSQGRGCDWAAAIDRREAGSARLHRLRYAAMIGRGGLTVLSYRAAAGAGQRAAAEAPGPINHRRRRRHSMRRGGRNCRGADGSRAGGNKCRDSDQVPDSLVAGDLWPGRGI